jgi:hypothetical protein
MPKSPSDGLGEKKSRRHKSQWNMILTAKELHGIPLAFGWLMIKCLQDVQEVNYKEKGVKESYYPAVKTCAIIKNLRRELR